MALSIVNTRVWVVLATLFLTNIFTTALAAVPAAVYVAQGQTSDPSNNVTVAVNVPANSSSDLFFHFSAPAGQSWAAFGFGDQMKGALMFVIYASLDGQNVTVSPRLGTGHAMPQHTSAVTVNLLEGSGIVDSVFVVNAMCAGCRSWNDGSVDVNSTSQSMIWAVGPPMNLQSNDLSATIQQHEAYDTFSMNLEQATGVGGVPSGADATTATGSTSNGHGPITDDGFHAGVGFHAVVMIGAFLIIFPTGYLFLRLFERVGLHSGIQSFALVLVLVGTASGIAVSIKQDKNKHLTSGHQILGLIVAALVLCTWTVGFIGHRMYKKSGAPAKPMKVHKILGPLSVALGLINAIVGFNFAGDNRAIIPLVIVATLVTIFVGTVTYLKRRNSVRKQAMNSAAAENFRQGQMEPQYTGQYGGPAIPLQSYGDRPQPQTLPSYHSDAGYSSDDRPPVYR